MYLGVRRFGGVNLAGPTLYEHTTTGNYASRVRPAAHLPAATHSATTLRRHPTLRGRTALGRSWWRALGCWAGRERERENQRRRTSDEHTHGTIPFHVESQQTRRARSATGPIADTEARTMTGQP